MLRSIKFFKKKTNAVSIRGQPLCDDVLFHSNPWLTKWPKFHVLGILIDSGDLITLDFLRKFFSQEYNFLAMYGNQKNNNVKFMYDDVNAEKMIFVFFGQTTGDFLTVLKPFLRNHIYLIVCYYYVFEKNLSKTGRKVHHIQTQIMPLSVIAG